MKLDSLISENLSLTITSTKSCKLPVFSGSVNVTLWHDKGSGDCSHCGVMVNKRVSGGSVVTARHWQKQKLRRQKSFVVIRKSSLLLHISLVTAFRNAQPLSKTNTVLKMFDNGLKYSYKTTESVLPVTTIPFLPRMVICFIEQNPVFRCHCRWDMMKAQTGDYVVNNLPVSVEVGVWG